MKSFLCQTEVYSTFLHETTMHGECLVIFIFILVLGQLILYLHVVENISDFNYCFSKSKWLTKK